VAAAETAVLTLGVLQAGTKENVIPDEAIIKLNVRTFERCRLVRFPNSADWPISLNWCPTGRIALRAFLSVRDVMPAGADHGSL
jgi:hypothetical protein